MFKGLFCTKGNRGIENFREKKNIIKKCIDFQKLSEGKEIRTGS